MDIVFVASEAVPFAKTGGLADVVGSLPREIANCGHRVRLFLPGYRQALSGGTPTQSTGITLQVPIAGKSVTGELIRCSISDSKLEIFFINQPDYFDRDQLYGESGQDYADNCERFVFFCRAVMESLLAMETPVNLLHCHDWQTGLIPAYKKLMYRQHPVFVETASLLTIHNLAYQGRFPGGDMQLTGLDEKHFNWREMEFHGDLNLMKTGIVFADRINTVSPHYAKEVQQPPLSCGLEDLLQHRSDVFTGIVNGIDQVAWNPEIDPHLACHYSKKNWHEGKSACKASLQTEMGLPVDLKSPLIGLIGRLAWQKGWDIALPVLEQRLAEADAQWVILGSGDPNLEEALRDLANKYPERLSAVLTFDEAIAHQIEAGCDLFVMASRYEPCGLNQLYSLRYGTVPLVHSTGGLIDTIVDTTPETLTEGSATGFHFSPFTSAALDDGISKALKMYHEKPENWNQLIETGMSQDWSWNRSAQEYIQLYQETQFSRQAKRPMTDSEHS